MQRDVPALRNDIRNAANNILLYTQNATLDEYVADGMLRSAVERQFLIIGEAIARARQISPDIMRRITSAAAIVAFRNHLVHGYESISDETVWDAVHKSLPVLLSDVEILLTRMRHEATPSS